MWKVWSYTTLDVVNPDILYGNYIYKFYYRFKSPRIMLHFVTHKYIKKNHKVLDIGSNDGLFLDYLNRGRTYSIDPKLFLLLPEKKSSIFNDYLTTSALIKLKNLLT